MGADRYFPIHLDNNPFWIIIPSSRPRGALHEASGVGREAAPAGGGGRILRTRGAGVAVRAYYGALPSMAGRGTGKRREIRLTTSPEARPHSPQRRGGAPRGDATLLRRRRRSGSRTNHPTRRSARRHPSRREGRKSRRTRAFRAAGLQTLVRKASFTVTPSAICATHSHSPGAAP